MADAASQNWYEILGVPPDADATGIRNAYRREAMRWHPSRHAGEGLAEAEERFRRIGAAYKTLSDPAQRAEYDVWRATGQISGAAGARGVGRRADKVLAFSTGLKESEAARLFFEQMLALSAELKRKGYRGGQRLKILESLGCPDSVVRAVAEYTQQKRRQHSQSAENPQNGASDRLRYSRSSATELPEAIELAEWSQIKPYYVAVIGGRSADARMDEATYQKHLARFKKSLSGYVLAFVLLLVSFLFPRGGWLFIGGLAALILTLVWRLLLGESWAFHRERAMRRYLSAFKRFHNDPAAAGGWRFNLGGFFGGILWLAYRRMSRYMLIAIAAAVLFDWIQIFAELKFGFLISDKLWTAIAIPIGFFADRIYFEHARQRIRKVLLYPRRQALAQLREDGGASWMGCLGYLLLFIILSLPGVFYERSVEMRQAMYSQDASLSGQQTAGQAARQKLVAEAAERSMQIRKERFDAVVAETQARYPQLDPKHPRYDRELAERVNVRTQNYIRQGRDPIRARRMAAAEVDAAGSARQSKSSK